MAEERARWAAEKRLSDLKELYGNVNDFIGATSNFRLKRMALGYHTSQSEATAAYKLIRDPWIVALEKILNQFVIDFELAKSFRELKDQAINLEPSGMEEEVKQLDDLIEGLEFFYGK